MSTVAEIVAATLITKPITDAPESAAAPVSSPERPSGQPILARNPFDSVTGPLVPKAGGETQTRKAPRVVDPLSAPKCEGVRVDATTESSDPPVPVSNLSNVVQIATFSDTSTGGRSCALLGDGTARCWGQDESGSYSDGNIADRLNP